MGNRINELRKSKKLTLKDFASELNKFTEHNRERVNTVTYSTISRWEKGITEPSLLMWQEMADYFNVSVGYLQGIIEDDSRKIIVNSYQKELLSDIDLLIEILDETITRSETFTDRDVAFLLSGLELSKKITNFTKNRLLLPPRMRPKKELDEYFKAQIKSLLKAFVVNVPETSNNRSAENSADQ